jgi:dTMP kinase
MAGYTVPLMSPRGKLLAVEGIDGAGKRTQVELLDRALDARGIAHFDLSFPRYQSFFGQAVTRYLTGEFGRLDQVDAHFSALLYAGDRLEAKRELDAALAAGRLVLADRYVGSNLAHQGARVPADRREEFLAWVRRLEYEVFSLPHEDLVIYLRVPVEESSRRTAARGKRLERDIQEGDPGHLREAAAVYESLASGPEWSIVEGFDLATGTPRAAEDIHKEILSLVERRLLATEGTVPA